MPDKNNVLVSALIMGVSKFCKWVHKSFFFLVDNFSNKEKEQMQMKLLKLSFYLHMIKADNKKSGETLGYMVLRESCWEFDFVRFTFLVYLTKFEWISSEDY